MNDQIETPDGYIPKRFKTDSLSYNRLGITPADSSYGFAEALERTDDNISRLEEAMTNLYRKLEPLLIPSVDAVAPDSMAERSTSDIASRVFRQNDRLDNVIDALQTLNRRIDL